MRYIDLHCDTLMGAYLAKKDDLYQLPDTSVDIQRLQQVGAGAQFFAIFLPPRPDDRFLEDEAYIRAASEIWHTTAHRHPEECALCKSARDYKNAVANNKVGMFLTIEDGRSVKGDLQNLQRYWDMGVRLISLTWNFENCFGYPNSPNKIEMDKGLKDFGRDAVAYMNQLGMIVDVSHLSDGGFWDVLQLSSKPVVASHSNARAITPHPRNLTDDMILALAKQGGVAGLNFCPYFLGESIECQQSRVADMVRHVQHLLNVGGEDLLALGSDLDGIGGQLEIDSCHKMDMLWNALSAAHIGDDVIEKMAEKNILRVIEENMG